MSERFHPIFFFFLVYMTQSGLILFSLPRVTAETFGTNGWLAILIIAMAVFVILFVIHFIYNWSHGISIYTLIEEMLPKQLYNMVYILLSLFWTLLAFMIAKKYAYLVKFLYYPLTNIHLLMLIITILIYYLVTSGIQSIVRMTTFLFFLTIWMVLMLVFFIPEFEFVRLTSYIFQYKGDLLTGSLEIYSAFLGFELMMFFWHHAEKSPKVMKYIYLGNLYTTFIYLAVTLLCYGTNSFEQLTHTVYPLIHLLRYLQLPFIERLDSLYFLFFLMKILVTSTMYLYVSIQMLSRVNKSIQPYYIPIVLAVIGFCSTYPFVTRFEIDYWLTNMAFVQTLISIALPLFLFTYLLSKRRKSYG
ncbi:GerAB/ArcD/ProY family transporter [Halalkalibacter akibai]|uniref:Uncharacterized protein n=1 Tax=Halalkalibacter akibai (strain ATCC 43226 / DSM 21942 / CIP 109018 / JCM 9157 / 1139) TaxID=1236973 RepID=W4QXV2_HALA3|nr:GerAB/ArcD/ProY family transporter [Halalkalibacter akibai]GAE36164.1 hypothetical protein JCM9157_3315 [Halalkalibacter akibai JCM 9157]